MASQAVGLPQLHRAPAAAVHGLLPSDRRCQGFRARVTGEERTGRAERGGGSRRRPARRARDGGDSRIPGAEGSLVARGRGSQPRLELEGTCDVSTPRLGLAQTAGPTPHERLNGPSSTRHAEGRL